jgi:AAA15 family ATPase/GTPase
LPYYAQSLGTKTLYNTIWYYIIALEAGGILVMDEFDIDFHPHMLQSFVNYFDDAKTNKQNAQMIFSTHNTDILKYMGKYRTVILNKEDSESYGYRLDEIPGDIIRNDRSIISVYNSGKIGGIPRI